MATCARQQIKIDDTSEHHYLTKEDYELIHQCTMENLRDFEKEHKDVIEEYKELVEAVNEAKHNIDTMRWLENGFFKVDTCWCDP